MDRALVLEAAGIPHQVIQDGLSSAIVVPAERSAEAARELRLYDEENPDKRQLPPSKIEVFDPLPGLIGYVLIVCLVAGFEGYSFFNVSWRSAGLVDGFAIRDGEIWRLFTALTLHSGVRHLLANLVFGVFFGLFAGRLLGSGYAWLVIVLAAGVGNLINTLLLEPTHRALGASTAVFAALGLVAGYVWRGKLMSQEQNRWSTRYGPIVGGLALLMYTGTGAPDEITGINNTDVGAHLLGFVMGFISGMLLIRYGPLPQSPRNQALAGAGAAGIVIVSWIVALTVHSA